jgi:hypothetical protein
MFFTTLASESSLHRLWYDLRNQTRYESALRAEVSDIETRRAHIIWNVVDRYCELRGEPSRMSESLVYVTFDGIFQRGLDDLLTGVDIESLESRRLLDEAFDAL